MGSSWKEFLGNESFKERAARAAKQRPKFQPHAEQLEDRVALSVFSPTYVNYQLAMAPANGATFTGSGLTPTQVRNAYGINGITFQSNSGATITGDGSGQTIAIVDAYDDPSIAAELSTFDQQFGIAAPPSFVKVGISASGRASTTSFPAADQGWAGEIALDVEWAHAIAPQANILLVEANSAYDNDLVAAVDYARKYPGVVAVSMSWGGGESSGETVDDSHFTTPAGHAGVTFFASSGDDSTIGYPAISSRVVAVGGTALTVDSAGNYVNESAWNAGGGGFSRYINQPSYQSNLVIHNGSQLVAAGGRRAGPDVAFVGDPATGVAVYGSYGLGGWTRIGGTSAGAPQWAALMAIVDQGRVAGGKTSMDGFTQTLPALYQLPSSDFHDITTGSNGNGNIAGPGFDLVTGRGTPVAGLLVAALSGNSGPKAPTLAQAAQVVSATDTTVTLNALGADAAGESSLSYNWALTGTPPGAVTFNANGNNAAKNTTAVLSQAGTYNFQVTITDAAGLSVTSQLSYTVSAVLTSLSVSPASATIAANASTQFTATALDQFGGALASQQSFTWSLDSGSAGTVNATSGLYTAPAAGPGSATIRATSGTVSGTASVSISAPPVIPPVTTIATTSKLTAGPVVYHRYGPPTVTLTVTITPASGTALPGGTVQLLYNGSVLGTATVQVVKGVARAQFSVQFSAYGNYGFTAQYTGASNFQDSLSNSVTVVV